RVEITDADVRAAKNEWLAARDGVDADRDVERALWYYKRLISTQAQQIADRVREPGYRRPS
ncbi:MAG: hypothetical protein HHJ14_09340, partial [Cellulomonas sp.]|nr:hypothetical protein [Cellulomonas sp.]